MSITDKIKKFYIRTTGYSYTNLGRLFLRLFVGIMMLQFGLKQVAHYYDMRDCFPAVLGMTSEASLIVMTAIEFVCALFIMTGFLTRIMTIPPFLAMIAAEIYIYRDEALKAVELLSWQQQNYLPIMFLGIYFFILLVGPGKISIDYFLSLHLLHSADESESELEEV